MKLVQKEGRAKSIKWKTEFVFDEELDSEEPLGEDKIVCNLTFSDGNRYTIYETDKSFMVPDFKTKASPDGFKLGKTILQASLSLETVKVLLNSGKSSLIDGFISKRTKRPFKAHLTFDINTGKIGFEFPPSNRKSQSKK